MRLIISLVALLGLPACTSAARHRVGKPRLGRPGPSLRAQPKAQRQRPTATAGIQRIAEEQDGEFSEADETRQDLQLIEEIEPEPPLGVPEQLPEVDPMPEPTNPIELPTNCADCLGGQYNWLSDGTAAGSQCFAVCPRLQAGWSCWPGTAFDETKCAELEAAMPEQEPLPAVEQGPLETAPANLGNLCSSESLQTETGIASCTEACAPAKCCQTDLGSANCGFVECASYGECTALASLIGVDVPVTLPEVEEEKEDPFEKIACPDGYAAMRSMDNCIVCFPPTTASFECAADCGLETCDFVPADCGVVICAGTDSPTAAVMESPTAAPTVRTVTAAPTEGVDPTSAAAGGRTVVMVMTTVVGAVALLWI